MPIDRGRTLRALKNAAMAGDERAVQMLQQRLADAAHAERPIGAMSPEEIARLDPTQHGGVEAIPLEDTLAVAGGAGVLARPAIAGAKVAGKVAGKVLRGAGYAGAGGGGGAYLYDKLTGE